MNLIFKACNVIANLYVNLAAKYVKLVIDKLQVEFCPVFPDFSKLDMYLKSSQRPERLYDNNA